VSSHAPAPYVIPLHSTASTAALTPLAPPHARLSAWFTRTLDVRTGERRLLLVMFGILLLTISAHTMLETARDTLLLAKMPRRSLGIVYILIAFFTLPAGAGASWVSQRWGPRRSLFASLLLAAACVLTVRSFPATPVTAMTLYVLTGLIGAVLVPQFWSLSGSLFTVAQGRRLLGPIASAGVVGGFLGSAGAALAVRVVSTKQLLIISAVLLVAAAVLIFLIRTGGDSVKTTNVHAPKTRTFSRDAIRDIVRDPFVMRIAGLVCLSASAVQVLDYLFKWSVSVSVPAENLGSYLATYYTFLNAISLVMQVFVGGVFVRRLGVANATLVTPSVLGLASLSMAFFGGAHHAVLVAKGVDGALRHSVHRITTELVYLPIPIETRARVKPLIDGALARGSQALVACVLLAAAETGVLTRGRMVGFVCILLLGWLSLAAHTRKPYLEIFRRAIARDDSLERFHSRALDFATVEMLVERLAHRNSDEVLAAIRVLSERGRERSVPALILYHPDPEVLVHALSVFGLSERSDWIRLAEPLLHHVNEHVRMAALRALCRKERLDALRNDEAASPRIRGYTTVWHALREGGEAGVDVRLARILKERPIDELVEFEQGMATALADIPKHSELGTLLLLLFRSPQVKRDALPEHIDQATRHTELLCAAAVRQSELRCIPLLIERLSFRFGRDAARDALAQIGKPAFVAISEALRDLRTPRGVRVQLPRAIARFASQEAADLMLASIEHERDGLVRYKSIQSLNSLAIINEIRVDARRVERLSERNLSEHLRLLSLRVALALNFDASAATNQRRALATKRFLEGLLEDKMRQALERAFRLLKMAYPDEDIHNVYQAVRSNNKRARANAGEFLDTLLTRRREQKLRAMLRLILDDLSLEGQAARASAFLEREITLAHRTAVIELSGDRDSVLASIANDHARALGDAKLISLAEVAHAARSEAGRPHRLGLIAVGSESPLA
jgi:ATP:ADP antiporter, AAA family